MIRFILACAVVFLAVIGGYTLYSHEQPSRKATDIAVQVGETAEQTTRKVINVSEKTINAAKAARDEFNK